MVDGLLYRGVNLEFHKRNNGKISPKENLEFKKPPKWNIAQWGSSWRSSEKNAVNEHQHHQAGYPTSGISTTPYKERAELYATHNGIYDEGVVYVIDVALCGKYFVSAYVVSEIVAVPSIPEDGEVILVSRDFGDLPKNVVTNVYHVNA
jgi:hypothetical protein